MILALLAFAQLAGGTPTQIVRDRDRSIALVEGVLRSQLKDPDSAKFTWLGRIVRGSYQPLLRRRIQGWVICGTINARNGYGGYTGNYAAIGVVSEEVLLAVDMDSPGRWSPDAGWVAEQCRKNGLPVF